MVDTFKDNAPRTYIEVEGRKVNVPRGSKGCITEDPSIRVTGEKLGRIEYDAKLFKNPAEMDGEEFEWWLSTAPPESLEQFCSINKAQWQYLN